MSLNLDARQRAMLAEIGVRVWQRADAPAPATPLVTTTAVVPVSVTPISIAASAISARAEQPKGLQQTPVQPDSPPFAATHERAAIAAMPWPELQQAVATCQACALCKSRTNTVFGVGHPQADWLVVGEAPGENEDLQGEPFVGAAGQLLDNMLKAIGMTRSAENKRSGVYITNTLKCRPPGNRNPEAGELAQCAPFLQRQVELVQPKIILAMGRFAVQSLLGSTEPLGKLRGRVHAYPVGDSSVPLVVTYHPAYLLRNLPDKAKAWADLCLAQSVLKTR